MASTERLFLHDSPLSDATGFNFQRVVNTLHEFVLSVPDGAPFSICVSGGWGSGKTTLMRSLAQRLEAAENVQGPRYVPIWFDPWKLSTAEEVRHALTRRVLDVIERDSSFLQGAGIEIDRKNVLRMLAERLLKVDADSLSTFYRADANTRGTFVEVEDIFRRVADVYLGDSENCRRLVVFVDDLDRCSHARAVEVLETVQLFFDLPGLVFVFGLDRDQLERAVMSQYDYSDDDARVYLEKMFQLTVPLPRKGIDDLGEFLADNLREVGVERLDAGLRTAIVNRFGRNLRNLKLFINSFSFQRRLTEHPDSAFDEEFLFKWLYLEATMARSVTASLKQGSLNIVVALELLANGGFLHDERLLAEYASQLKGTPLNYVALVVYAIVSANPDAKLSNTRLSTAERVVVEALRADGSITSTLQVLREGHVRLLDGDLERIVFLTRSGEVKATDGGSEAVYGSETVDPSALDSNSLLTDKDWNDLGDELMREGHTVDAYLCYLMSWLAKPHSAVYLTDLGQVFRRVGRRKAAEWLYWRAYSIDRTSSYALGELALLYDSAGDTQTGSLFYRLALLVGSTGPAIPNNLSVNLSNEGKHEDAYLASIDAYLKDPENPIRKRRMMENAVQIGRAVGIETRSPADLDAELKDAMAQGRYPLQLTADELRAVEALATRNREVPTEELSRPLV